MKVKVGDTIYDSNEQPVMVILTEKDKQNIAMMASTATKFCSFPESWDARKVQEWMATDG